MKLSSRIRKQLNARLVVRINELYHDLENAAYEGRQVSCFQREARTWEDFGRRLLAGRGPLRVLDYGTGSGFVPMTLGPHLGRRDELICCDLSEGILDVCRQRVEGAGFACAVGFRKGDGRRIPAATDSVDALTMNSVLHHIRHLAAFGRECARVLRPGGLLIVAHEPNGDYHRWGNHRRIAGILRPLADPGHAAQRIVEASPLIEAGLRPIVGALSPAYRRRNAMLREISERLVGEGWLDFYLRGTEIQQIVDIHTHRGLRKDQLLKKAFPDFEVVEWTTYGYLSGVSNGIPFVGALRRRLEKSEPQTGTTMAFVLRKS